MKKFELKIAGEVKKLSLKSDDVILVKIKERLDMADMATFDLFKRQIKKIFPKNKCVVYMRDQLEFEIISKGAENVK